MSSPSAEARRRAWETVLQHRRSVTQAVWNAVRGTPFDFEELLAVAYEAALTAAESYDGRGDVGAWLYRKVDWALKDWKRTGGRSQGWERKRGRIAHVSATDPTEFAGASLPDESADQAFEKVELRALLSTLQPRAAEVLRLYYTEGLTLYQIGALFGVTESRICQIHRAALAELRSHLEGEST
jgi:RNA polymerase sigma factor (sigma-70 family)